MLVDTGRGSTDRKCHKTTVVALALGIVINVALLLTWLWLVMAFLARGGRIETTSAEIH